MRHKKIYSVRDNKAGGAVLGEYTAAEAAQVIGCNYNSISSYASTGAWLYGRYSIDPVGVVEWGHERLMREWDETRLKLLELYS